MWMMFRVVPIMWHAVRPSRVVDMPAVVNSFWMRKGFEGLTFFGHILTPSQAEADLFGHHQGFICAKPSRVAIRGCASTYYIYGTGSRPCLPIGS